MRASDEDKQAFAKRFTELRRRRGFTQIQIGRALKMSSTVAYYWESGKAYPNPDSMVKLAEFFGVTPQYLAHGEGPETEERGSTGQPLVEAIVAARQRIAGLAGVEVENVRVVIDWGE